MVLRKHVHPTYVQWFRRSFSILAFFYPVYIIIVFVLHHAPPFISMIFPVLLGTICTLVAAYFFQDVWVDEEGLIIEFLWAKLHVPWDRVLQIKPLFGALGRKQGVSVVIVDGLTPFHRLYGLIYGFSSKPAFVLWPTLSNYRVLKSDLEKHIKQNQKSNKYS